MRFYEASSKGGGTFDQGIEQIVAAVLASPNFLYRGIWGKGAHELLSPILNWPRVFLSSSGTPAPTRNC